MALKKFKNSLLLFLIIMIAFLSGFFGSLTLLVTRKIKIPFFKELNLDRYLPKKEIVIETKEMVTISEEEELNKIIKKLENKIAKIYFKKPVSKNILEQIYLDKEILGYGFILSNDGWVISYSEVFPDLKRKYILIIERKAYEIEKFLKDSLTKIVFLKIKGENLSVTKLAEKEDIFLGENVFLFDGKKIESAKIKELKFKEIRKKEDIIESSESFDFFSLTKDLKNYQGLPLINFKEAVLGTFSEDGRIIPVNYFKSIISQVLKDQKIKRSFLGINYLDLNKNIGIEGLENGAFIYSLVKNSPAEKAGFRKNDIILKIENYSLNHQNSLNELIQEYSPGQEIEITFLREKEEKKVKVKLEELK